MKDFASLREIDVQGLLTMLRNARDAPCLQMMKWITITDCQTAGCLVGTFCLNNQLDAIHVINGGVRLKEGPLAPCYEFFVRRAADTWCHVTPSYPPTTSLTMDEMVIGHRFGLSLREVRFLFTCGHLKSPGTDNTPGYRQACIDATNQEGDDAIRRLEKFLYYKMRKAELLEDLDSAKRLGDVGIMNEGMLVAS